MAHNTPQNLPIRAWILASTVAVAVAFSVHAFAEDTIQVVPKSPMGWALPDADTTIKNPAKTYGFETPKPSTRKAPPNHTADFLKRHGPIAKASASDCASCHKEQECLDCHQGTLKPVNIHPPSYLEIHALEAHRGTWSCTSCHAPQTFCRDCHQLAKAGSTGAAAPPPGVQYHPPGWTGQGSGAYHGREARKNLMACVSCHQERDCVQCHAAINPHPSNFTAHCRSLLSKNGRSCTTCHVDLSQIQALCR